MKSDPENSRLSSVHDDSGIATREMLAAAGLIGQDSITVVGAPVTGKQTTFATAALIEQTSFLVLDPKLELLPICHRRRAEIGPVRWIVPFKEDLPPDLGNYNPLNFLDPKSESFDIDCDALAEMLVVQDGSGETRDTAFFSDNAQGALSGVITQLVGPSNAPGSGEHHLQQADSPSLPQLP